MYTTLIQFLHETRGRGGGGRAELNCPRHVQTYLKKEPFIVDLQSFSIFPKFVKKQFCVKTVGFFFIKCYHSNQFLSDLPGVNFFFPETLLNFASSLTFFIFPVKL